MVRSLSAALAVCVLCVSNLSGQDVALSARVDSTTYRIGDWVDVHIEARISPGVEYIVPAFKDSVGSFEVLKLERDNSEPRWLVRLFSLDSGKVFLPPMEYSYRRKGDTTALSARTNPIFLTFVGIPINAQGDIKDIKPPRSAPWKFEDFLPYVIALILLGSGVGGYLYYTKKRKLKQSMMLPEKPALPPHELALFQLRELEDKKLWQQGKVKEFYSEATEIVRRFFEGRWSIVALELTSDEILAQMKSVEDSSKVWKEMVSFFTNADLVKFAKYNPSPADHEHELTWAYEIVRAMVPRVQRTVESNVEEAVDVR